MQKYWLAENGEVRCMDDRCPQECDMECPIYLQTISIPFVQNGHFEEAAKYLAKAVRIEPTFAEAWNNLAACYGQMGNHQGAYEAYLKSFDLVEKPNPLFGMAVAAKNMGRSALAMQYVALYERRYGLDDRLSSLKAEITEKQLEKQIGNSSAKAPQNTQKAPPEQNKKEPVQQANADEEDDQGWKDKMRAFGSIYLKLLDETTREEGYGELEKLEVEFPEAGVVLGQYYQGDNADLAKKYFKTAADASIAEGQWGYSQLLQHTFVLDLSSARDQEYLKYCLAAAEGGCPDAANEMGNICHRLGFYEESTYWYGMAYVLEHPDGMTSMQGITKEWKQKGIEKVFHPHIAGFTEDKWTTSHILLKMFTSPLNTKDMDDLMRLALAGENLAGLIEARIFEEHNQDAMAYKVYNALSFENHPYVLRCYADMLLAGKGTTRNVEGAFRMYEIAAKGGNAVAMFAMGQKALKGGDPLLAAAWFGMAYTRGMEMAGDWLVKLQEN